MDTVIAYKFTSARRRSKYGVTDYPEIGQWSGRRTPKLCRSGWHVPVLLSKWINTELWKVEVKGKSVGDGDKVAWEYVRFVERVEDWNVAAMKDFIVHCCYRHAYADVYCCLC